jgi:hypothetical protein
VFDIVEKSSKFLQKIITLVSSANKMGSDNVFIVRGRSFIYIMKTKALKLTPVELLCFTVPHFEDNFSIILFQFFVFNLSDRIRTS